MQRGIATFTLDYGKCPPWLFERMVNLSRAILESILREFGPDEFINRIGDPVWFQSLGTVLAFDWNASGLTTILTAALKEAIRQREREWGIFICGGKGKTSLKTPGEIINWGERLDFSGKRINSLVYFSKMSAKVDNSLLQDGFQIYHHSFFFSLNGSWSVVQQGMNVAEQSARRYHWSSKKPAELGKEVIVEPHSGINSEIILDNPLNLTAKKGEENRKISVDLLKNSFFSLNKDIKILGRYSTPQSQILSLKQNDRQLTFLQLSDTKFSTHPVVSEDFSKSKYLEKILAKLSLYPPTNYEKLVSTVGVGPKTLRALSLIAEVIYGAKASYEDPARYSFAHGGKDAIPYPVDLVTYDKTIRAFERGIMVSRLELQEKKSASARLAKIIRQINQKPHN